MAVQSETHRGIGYISQRGVKLLTGLEPRDIVRAFNQIVTDWNDDKVPRLGASLAFYTLLSSAPLLLVVVAVAALAYGQQAARGQLVWEIRDLVGFDTAKAIQEMVQNAYKPASGLIATVLGIATAVVGSTSVVVELRDALNTIWHVPPAPNTSRISSLVQVVKERFYSFGLVLGGGILLLLSLALNTWAAATEKFLGAILPASPLMLQVVTFAVSFILIALIFGAIYKFLPDVTLCWRDVIVGAFVTAFFFEIGKQLIGLYLGRSTFSSAYGAAGSLVVLLVWVYYSAQVFFLGAEFTKAFTQARIRVGKRPPQSIILNHD
jgi:membrane protein